MYKLISNINTFEIGKLYHEFISLIYVDIDWQKKENIDIRGLYRLSVTYINIHILLKSKQIIYIFGWVCVKFYDSLLWLNE